MYVDWPPLRLRSPWIVWLEIMSSHATNRQMHGPTPFVSGTKSEAKKTKPNSFFLSEGHQDN